MRLVDFDGRDLVIGGGGGVPGGILRLGERQFELGKFALVPYPRNLREGNAQKHQEDEGDLERSLAVAARKARQRSRIRSRPAMLQRVSEPRP